MINFDLPFAPEDFLHRIGRTARAGRAGTAITFVTVGDMKMYEKIKPYLQGAEEVKVDASFTFTGTKPDLKKRVDKYEDKAAIAKAAKPRFSSRNAPFKR